MQALKNQHLLNNNEESLQHILRGESDLNQDLETAKHLAHYGDSIRKEFISYIQDHAHEFYATYGTSLIDQVVDRLHTCHRTIKTKGNGEIFPSKRCGMKYLCPSCLANAFKGLAEGKRRALLRLPRGKSPSVAIITLTIPNNDDPLHFHRKSKDKNSLNMFTKYLRQRKKDLNDKLERGTISPSEYAFLHASMVFWKYEVSYQRPKFVMSRNSNPNFIHRSAYHHHLHMTLVQLDPHEQGLIAIDGANFISEAFGDFCRKNSLCTTPITHVTDMAFASFNLDYLYDVSKHFQNRVDHLAIHLQLKLLQQGSRRNETHGMLGTPLGHTKDSSPTQSGKSNSWNASTSSVIYERRD